MHDDDYLAAEESLVEDGPARNGYLWVNPNTHTVIATGDQPKPSDTPHAKLRRYFSDLDRGLTEFGEFESSPAKRTEVLRVCDEMESILNAQFRECFFVVDDTRTRTQDYLAIVFGNRRGGSVWAKKNVIHTTAQVRNSAPYKNSLTLFQLELSGFHEKGSAGKKQAEIKKPLCPYSQLELPLNGKCDDARPGCPVCATQST
jgi:hypothetical protein